MRPAPAARDLCPPLEEALVGLRKVAMGTKEPAPDHPTTATATASSAGKEGHARDPVYRDDGESQEGEEEVTQADAEGEGAPSPSGGGIPAGESHANGNLCKKLQRPCKSGNAPLNPTDPCTPNCKWLPAERIQVDAR